MQIRSADIEWPTLGFMVVNSLVAIAGTTYLVAHIHISAAIWVFTVIYAAAANLSITAGYHRMFSHCTYNVPRWVEWAYLIVGASAFEGPALKWSSDHRVHHAHVDTQKDPYSIKRGFFWAHMGWLFFKETVARPILAPDLQRNPRVKLQYDYYYYMAFGFGFGLPLLVGFLCGQPIAGFIIGGSLRIFFNQQSTFFINSICHTWGKQTYSTQISARDSFWVAILTHGEGYHNFHHRFQLDYRNGLRWYDWDPTKWFILLLATFGQARKLRRADHAEILSARLLNEEQTFKMAGYSAEKIELMKSKILQAHRRIKEMRELYASEYKMMKSRAENASRTKIQELKNELRATKTEFSSAMRDWKKSLRLAMQATSVTPISSI